MSSTDTIWKKEAFFIVWFHAAGKILPHKILITGKSNITPYIYTFVPFLSLLTILLSSLPTFLCPSLVGNDRKASLSERQNQFHWKSEREVWWRRGRETLSKRFTLAEIGGIVAGTTDVLMCSVFLKHHKHWTRIHPMDLLFSQQFIPIQQTYSDNSII